MSNKYKIIQIQKKYGGKKVEVLITEDIIPKGQGARPGKKLTKCMGLVIHWIGVTQGHASVIRKNFGSDEFGAHYISDWYTGDIIHCVPDDEVCYHVGANKYTTLAKTKFYSKPNYYLVGIECCINPNDKIYSDYSSKTKYLDLGKPSDVQYEKLVAFAAKFLMDHDLTEKDLYRHYDITGKPCHVWFYKDEKRWDKFKADVKKRMEEDEVMTQVQFNQMFEVAMNDWMAKQAKKPASSWFQGSKEQKLVEDVGIVTGTGTQKAWQSLTTKEQVSKMLGVAIEKYLKK